MSRILRVAPRSLDLFRQPKLAYGASSSTTVGALRSDSFDRADSALTLGTPSDGGSAWSVLSGTWGISSNLAARQSAGSQESAVLDAAAANVDVQATFSTVGADCGLVARAADDSNYIVVTVTATALTLFKRVAGGFTQLGSTFNGTISNGDIIKLRCASTNDITVFQNGTSRITANDSAGSTNTKHGLRESGGSATCRWNDFSVVAAS